MLVSPCLSVQKRKITAVCWFAFITLGPALLVPSGFGQNPKVPDAPPSESVRIHVKQDDLGISCIAAKNTINLGESVGITIIASGANLIYSFGASAGTIIVTGNKATLNTAAVPKPESPQKAPPPIRIVCSVTDMQGLVKQTSAEIAIAAPQIPGDVSITDVKLDPPKVPIGFQPSLVVAPSLSWTTGTQVQTISGGSVLLSGVKSQSFCDSEMRQFGIAANASDTETTKAGTTSNIDNNELKLNGTMATFPRGPQGKQYSNVYLGANADFFDNNLLGIGLQQTYTAQAQFYFRSCEDKATPDPKHKDLPKPRWFASAGIGAGYMNQRLYATPNKLSAAVLPFSLQVSYLQGNKTGIPPKLIWYALVGYMPVLTDLHAYQLGAAAGLQIPTRYPWLTFSLTETDLYMNNAPPKFKRNYQNGTVSAVLTFPKPPEKIANPALPESAKGSCYGGDKLARLFCYDNVTADACAPPNMFRALQHCPSSGTGTVPTLEDRTALLKKTEDGKQGKHD
jgi:hypothetical protein